MTHVENHIHITRRDKTSRKQSLDIVLARWLFWIAAAWLLMLGIGIVHAHVLPTVIACDFGTTFLLLSMFGSAAVVFKMGWDL